MAINGVIELELDNKCMPNGINELGVHVDIYMYVFMLCMLCLFGFSSCFQACRELEHVNQC